MKDAVPFLKGVHATLRSLIDAKWEYMPIIKQQEYSSRLSGFQDEQGSHAAWWDWGSYVKQICEEQQKIATALWNDNI